MPSTEVNGLPGQLKDLIEKYVFRFCWDSASRFWFIFHDPVETCFTFEFSADIIAGDYFSAVTVYVKDTAGRDEYRYLNGLYPRVAMSADFLEVKNIAGMIRQLRERASESASDFRVTWDRPDSNPPQQATP